MYFIKTDKVFCSTTYKIDIQLQRPVQRVCRGLQRRHGRRRQGRAHGRRHHGELQTTGCVATREFNV